jgi:hypothetical protein
MTMGTETIAMDEKPKKKAPGNGRGTGRKPGSKNILTGQNKRDIREFFQTLTIDSMRWRTNVKKQLESGDDGTQLRYWSDLALKYGFGLPGKMEVTGEKRQSLYFVTTTGLPPFHPLMDNMKEQTDRMIQQAKDEARLQLEAPKDPVVIDVTKGDSDEVPETLEVVNPLPPEDPSAYR